MSKKGENIRKRKDGRWEGRYKRGTKENGSAIYVSIYGKTYKEVKDKLIIAKGDQEHEHILPNKERRFSEVLLLWSQTNKIRLKGASEQRYEYLIETHILPELGDLRLSQISATKINTFLVKKLTSGRLDGKGGLSPSYVRSIGIIIESALTFAVAEQMCPPLRSPIHKPQLEKKELEILDKYQQSVLENHTRGNLNATNIGILISLYTGLRIGEVCALSWNDIDFSAQILHVRHTVARVKNDNKSAESKTKLILDEPKTKASKRDIPIPAFLMYALKEYKNVSCSQYIISENNLFVSPRTYEYRYHKELEACSIASTNYHALRHTFASRCIEVGVDVKSLSEILGHQDPSITLKTYVHSSMSQKRMQLNKLDFVSSL